MEDNPCKGDSGNSKADGEEHVLVVSRNNSIISVRRTNGEFVCGGDGEPCPEGLMERFIAQAQMPTSSASASIQSQETRGAFTFSAPPEELDRLLNYYY